MAYGDQPQTVDGILSNLAERNAETVAINEARELKMFPGGRKLTNVAREHDEALVRGYGKNKNTGD